MGALKRDLTINDTVAGQPKFKFTKNINDKAFIYNIAKVSVKQQEKEKDLEAFEQELLIQKMMNLENEQKVQSLMAAVSAKMERLQSIMQQASQPQLPVGPPAYGGPALPVGPPANGLPPLPVGGDSALPAVPAAGPGGDMIPMESPPPMR